MWADLGKKKSISEQILRAFFFNFLRSQKKIKDHCRVCTKKIHNLEKKKKRRKKDFFDQNQFDLDNHEFRLL